METSVVMSTCNQIDFEELVRSLEDMDYGDMGSNLEVTMLEVLDASSPTAPPPPHHLHPQSGGYEGCSAHSVEQINTPFIYQGAQNLQPPSTQDAPPSQGQCVDIADANLPDSITHSQTPDGIINGEVLADCWTFTSAAVARRHKLLTREDDQDTRPYVKKPCNAFMVFAKEQRPNYAAVAKKKSSAAVNIILGEKWWSLTDEEKSKYYAEAEREKRLHRQLHPDWSAECNYGKKRYLSCTAVKKETDVAEPPACSATPVVDPSVSSVSSVSSLSSDTPVTEPPSFPIISVDFSDMLQLLEQEGDLF